MCPLVEKCTLVLESIVNNLFKSRSNRMKVLIRGCVLITVESILLKFSESCHSFVKSLCISVYYR